MCGEVSHCTMAVCEGLFLSCMKHTWLGMLLPLCEELRRLVENNYV